MKNWEKSIMKTFLQTDTIYNRLLVSIKDCRMKCIEDTLSGTNPDLYNALYSDSDKLIYKTKLELYELKWIELHLKKMNEIIDNKYCLSLDREYIASIIAKFYSKFIEKWNKSDFDISIFEEKKRLLKDIINTNCNWDSVIKQMEVAFERDRKILKKNIEKLKSKEN